MKRILLTSIMLLAVLTAFAEFKPYIGVSYTHDTEDDFKNPIAFFGVVYETKYFEPYIEHLSSVPTDDGYGLNLLGINTVKRFKDWKFYIGAAVHDTAFDTKKYGDDFSTVTVRYGVRYKYLFVEQIENRLHGGVRIAF